MFNRRRLCNVPPLSELAESVASVAHFVSSHVEGARVEEQKVPLRFSHFSFVTQGFGDVCATGFCVHCPPNKVCLLPPNCCVIVPDIPVTESVVKEIVYWSRSPTRRCARGAIVA